jgi:hypothetical protein
MCRQSVTPVIWSTGHVAGRDFYLQESKRFRLGPVLVRQQTEGLVETQRPDIQILHLLALCLGQPKPVQGSHLHPILFI